MSSPKVFTETQSYTTHHWPVHRCVNSASSNEEHARYSRNSLFARQWWPPRGTGLPAGSYLTTNKKLEKEEDEPELRKDVVADAAYICPIGRLLKWWLPLAKCTIRCQLIRLWNSLGGYSKFQRENTNAVISLNEWISRSSIKHYCCIWYFCLPRHLRLKYEK